MPSIADDDIAIVDVVIIGSGVAGLSAAISLQKLGLNVKIYEKDYNFIDRRQGYGMTLTNSINGPLAKLNILTECIEKNCLSTCHYVFNPNGDILGYYGREWKETTNDNSINNGNKSSSNFNNFNNINNTGGGGGGHQGNLRIPRQDLREMLLKLVLPNTIQWGTEVMDYIETHDHISLQLLHRYKSPDISNSTTSSNNNELLDDQSHHSIIETITTYLLIGADGIRSKIRQLRDMKLNMTHLSPLTYLGISVIVGLSTVSHHPCFQQRGFYVLDGTHRMFTMPYQLPSIHNTTNSDVNNNSTTIVGNNNHVDDDIRIGILQDNATNKPKEENDNQALTMWQLSFSGLSEDEANQLRYMAMDELIKLALKRTKDWFSPVRDLIEYTITDEIWATGLYDRDALPLLSKTQGTRVTIMGDAAHPMSMFKGQGANQALADGPLLAKWIDNNTKNNNNNNHYNNTKNHNNSATSNNSSSTYHIQSEERQPLGVDNIHNNIDINIDNVDNNILLKQNKKRTHWNEIKLQQHYNITTASTNTENTITNNHNNDSSYYNNLTTFDNNTTTNVEKIKANLKDSQSIYTKLRCYEREMMARTRSKQSDSRKAAIHLHSKEVLSDIMGISGVNYHGKNTSKLTMIENSNMLSILKEHQINAILGSELDHRMKTIIDQYFN